MTQKDLKVVMQLAKCVVERLIVNGHYHSLSIDLTNKLMYIIVAAEVGTDMSFCSDVYTVDKFVVTPETKKQWKKKGKEKWRLVLS